MYSSLHENTHDENRFSISFRCLPYQSLKSCFLIEHTRRGYFSSQPHLPRLIMEKAAHGVPVHYQLLLDREL
jgi:hypothetical protein